jgi:3-phosphoshikimate 1-carboxyvinyltransferase
VIKPFEGPVDATIRVPGSKSITNRALIIGALADGTSTIENPLFSDDPYWLMAALTGLGLPTKADRGTGTIIVKGQRGIIPKSEVEVFVGNAGTAARFLPPVLALGEGPYLVDGVARMRERPVGDLVEAMKGLGARVGYAGEEGRFPIEVEGGGIRGGVVGVRGTRSSQFLSGLLMAAPYAEEPVVLEVEGGLVSRPYIGITLGVMKDFGVEAEVGANYIEVRGPERLRGVEVDMNEISDTMITLGAIAPFASSPTTIKNVAHTRTQETDRIAAVAQELTRLGIRVEEYPDGMKISPGPVSSGTVRTYDDHRMAMAFSLLGLVVPGIRIQNPSCVTKTLPDYFQRLEALRP